MSSCPKVKIAFIPIDNRPVCYDLAVQIAQINKDIELFIPPIEYLGDLKKNANIESIFDWLNNLKEIDDVVVALDTIAYGGLIPSRRSKDTFKQIKSRIDKFVDILLAKKAKVYAFSSIMRISNNNINEEEKEYWNLYGEKIFKYSYEMHKNAPQSSVETDVPAEIIQDYLLTRKRNFEINQYYLELARGLNSKQRIFDTLVFSKDDCSKYGFNVAEAQALEMMIKEMGVCALVKTGADEILLSLLSRVVVKHFAKDNVIKISPVFTEPDFTDKISKYEDVSVFESVKGQIELAGCCISDLNSSDIVLVVNNFKEEQGELVMGVDVEDCKVGKEVLSLIGEKPYFVVDIRNANGADNSFVKSLFEYGLDKDNFLGYAGWNTTGNSLGSAICCALVKYVSKNINLNEFKKVQLIRFLDDWAYQANVRKKLKSYFDNISVEELKKEMSPFQKQLFSTLNFDPNSIDYSYPWERFFEIRVSVNYKN